LDEKIHVNIMLERTWEILGKPAMIPSLGRIGLFKGKMIHLITGLSMQGPDPQQFYLGKDSDHSLAQCIKEDYGDV
jgi:hypothetical protein